MVQMPARAPCRLAWLKLTEMPSAVLRAARPAAALRVTGGHW